MTFAVIATGGKQYLVSKGDIVTIEKLPVSAKTPVGKPDDAWKEGDKVVFSEVLLVDDGKDTHVGAPLVKGAKVTGTLKEAGKHKKIDVIRFKAKSRYFKRRGHRQPYHKVHIDSLS